MKLVKNTIIGGLLSLVTTAASALPIVGSIEMFGAFDALDASGSSTTVASDATALDFFMSDGTNVYQDLFRVSNATGDFASTANQFGLIQDLSFAPFSGPINNFWSVSNAGATMNFAFQLTGVNILPSSNPSDFLTLQGTGIITLNGGSATNGSWNFSGDTTGGGTFSWSSTTLNETISVPEPGILAMLSVGLIVVGARRKFGRKFS